jgi:putative acetyltransferase
MSETSQARQQDRQAPTERPPPLPVTVRGLRRDDVPALFEVYSCSGVIAGTLQMPFRSPEDLAQRLADAPPNLHRLVAEVDGKAVGSLTLDTGRWRTAHLGRLGMMVHDAHQGRGIGTALLAAAVELADRWLGLQRLELEVYTDNAPALRLYQKFGFEIEGTKRRYALRDGVFVDAHVMARLRPAPPDAPG